MNIPLNFTPPPHSPSASAIEAAFSLLAVAADPAGAQKRLADLVRATADVHDAVKELQDQHTRNQKALEAVDDLRARENAVAAKEGELQTASTRMAVASSAASEREAQLNRRQSELEALAKDLDQRELALADRLRGFRDALAG
jgi:hypothetical protein